MTVFRNAALFIAAAACTTYAQQSGPLKFEVASIKAAPPPVDGRLMVRMGGDKGRITFSNVNLMNLLTAAFKVKEHQIEGPGYLMGDRFDLTATFPEGATQNDVPVMLQELLIDRFKLKFHKESKTMQSYALVVAKGGSKMTPAEGPSGNLRMMFGPKGRKMDGVGTMAVLADRLSNAMDRPVVDMTELTGNFNIDLEWSGGSEGSGMMRMLAGHGGGPGGAGPGGPGPGPGASDPKLQDESADAPSIFTALQNKLGLKLEPKKSPVDLYIIDNIEKSPTEN
jgi:uncharacterized protein (TIGR03435 family)